MNKISIFTGILLLVLTSCEKDEPIIIKEDEDILLGGETTIFGSFVNIFQQPAANLSEEEIKIHFEADAAFGAIFVTAPSEINSGLGPIFNQNSCESCHVSNGRSPFPKDGSDLRGLLLRMSIPGEDINGAPIAVPNYGGQLQTKAVFGKAPEGKLTWQEVEEIRTYANGEKVSLRKFEFSIFDAYATLPTNILLSPRIAPPVIGLGLLEAIDESDIIALADENDVDGDGISGKPNMVWDFKNHVKTLGRFGWKAGQPSLLQQSAAAYQNDMGITSPYFTTESSHGQIQSDQLVDDPEIDEKTLQSTTFYVQSLAVPARRNTKNGSISLGKKLFTEINCASCHHPKFITSQHPEYDFLSKQTIYPYTDLLLHDMGEGLADHRPDFLANGSEWRTPPLWGIGLTNTVGGHTNFLHDGRARNLEEAILWHGGEAEMSKKKFTELPKEDRISILRFLESL